MNGTDTQTRTATVHTASVEWELTGEEMKATVARLEAANQRATDRGLSGRYSWTIDPEHHTRTRHVCLGDGEGPEAYDVQVQTITVTGQVPSFGGWQVLARFHQDAEGVATYHAEPGFEFDPEAYDPAQCDYCRIRRERTKTYVLAHAESGQVTQVGSSCLADFLGVNVSPAVIEASGSLFGDVEEATHSGGYGEDTHPVPVVLAIAAAAVRRAGWTPRSTDDPRATPTADLVSDALNGRSRSAQELREALRPTETDHETARQAQAWTQDHEGDSEYIQNLRAVMSADNVSPRNLGLAVSAVGTYQRAQEAERDRQAAKSSQWVGEVKQRQERTLTVLNVRTIEREAYHYYDSGLSWLVTFADTDGNRFKWFASKEPEFETGQTVTGKATIKEHTTYREVKETVLTRCKFEVN
ncbi:hypothetical protein NE857_33800 (plasmid) [Nocardiopsis exhalans]|uniref:Uncharacterized protein n=1 Tax=Nocardiopsis exhalans TaxID=163604 RepID=A0ABY5DJT9_9ACTN|nr:hypothetical protein [Nocardiopsis exhalans]USY23606.1 hypothetical protein NE857_33800 [Nocardiopsis exhalans]